MKTIERYSEVRGAQDLSALWRELPMAVIRYPAASLPQGVGLAALSDTLRARAWREHCRAPTAASCVESGGTCAFAYRVSCKADLLFPLRIGGGAEKWRMATLFVRWQPRPRQLRLVALGETACSLIGWAARVLREQHGLSGGETMETECLADVELRGATRWQLTMVTPWIVGKNTTQVIHMPDAGLIRHELGKSMRARAHKLTALCTPDPAWQRLGSHLAHHVADALLPDSITVECMRIQADTLLLGSRGNGSVFRAVTWSGEATVSIAQPLLPWLSLLAVCGVGENADKGFGGIDIRPSRDPECEAEAEKGVTA